MNRLAELERVLANSVVLTWESKQFDSELRSYFFHLLSNMFLNGSRGKNPGSQETVQIWQNKTKKNCHIWLSCAPNFSSIVQQCKWPFLSRKIVEFQKFCYHGNATSHFPFLLLYFIPFFLFRFSLFFACVLKLPIGIQISLNYIQRRHVKKETTHNYTHSGLSSKSKNIENYIFYILAKLDVNASSINNTDQSCLLFFYILKTDY